jgi:hypothetical protein
MFKRINAGEKSQKKKSCIRKQQQKQNEYEGKKREKEKRKEKYKDHIRV